MSCAASALTSYGSPELLQRQNDPSQQSSALDVVYRFLRSSSTPPTTTSASTASVTNPMMLRSTRLRQRDCTLVASLITIHSRRSIRAILVQRKNVDPLVVTITLNFCMLSLHNLTIFFSYACQILYTVMLNM